MRNNQREMLKTFRIILRCTYYEGDVTLMLFTYDLYSIGWAHVQIEINDQKLFMVPSYLTEPLIDLMNGIMSLLPECSHEDEIKQQSVFEWDSEPAIHRWILTRYTHTDLSIKVILYKDGDVGESGEVVFDSNCSLLDFISQLVHSLEKMLVKYGIVGYKTNWDSADFPLSGYIKLKYYVENNSSFPIEQLNKEEMNEYWKSNKSTELEIISKLLKS